MPQRTISAHPCYCPTRLQPAGRVAPYAPLTKTLLFHIPDRRLTRADIMDHPVGWPSPLESATVALTAVIASVGVDVGYGGVGRGGGVAKRGDMPQLARGMFATTVSLLRSSSTGPKLPRSSRAKISCQPERLWRARRAISRDPLRRSNTDKDAPGLSLSLARPVRY
jgi:hypothetical protein